MLEWADGEVGEKVITLAASANDYRDPSDHFYFYAYLDTPRRGATAGGGGFASVEVEERSSAFTIRGGSWSLSLTLAGLLEALRSRKRSAPQ